MQIYLQEGCHLLEIKYTYNIRISEKKLTIFVKLKHFDSFIGLLYIFEALPYFEIFK